MVQTAPAASGIDFALDGKRFTSDGHGLALVRVTHSGLYRLRVIDDAISRPGRRSVFVGWSDGPTKRSRNIKINTFTWMRATYEVRYRVRPRFTDASGNNIFAPRIDGLILRADDGTKTTLSGGWPYWITGEAASSQSGAGYSKTIAYVVEGVVVDGEEVPPARQSPIVPAASSTWTVRLQQATQPPAPSALKPAGSPPRSAWVSWAVITTTLLAAVAVTVLGLRRRVKPAGAAMHWGPSPAPPEKQKLGATTSPTWMRRSVRSSASPNGSSRSDARW
jgi:hypothetical protein